MKFSIQLSSDYPDKAYGGDRVYQDMLAQATLADRLGYDAVAITEHHFMNCLMMPAPLQFAVKIAAHTEQLKIITAISILPIRDMRIFAGEVVVADIFTEGRLLLGVGRGNFAYEIERLGIPMEETRARFDESLEVLQALLREEEVSWDGTYYKFDPITVMPRPMNPGGPPMMMAAVNPDAIYHCAQAGLSRSDNAAWRAAEFPSRAGGSLQSRQGGSRRGRQGHRTDASSCRLHVSQRNGKARANPDGTFLPWQI